MIGGEERRGLGRAGQCVGHEQSFVHGLDWRSMRFALNYSPQAEELLDARAIDIDLFKCPARPDLVRDAQRRKPAYVHFALEVGGAEFAPDWRAIEALRAATATRCINVHLTAATGDYPDIPIMSQNPDHQSRILEQAILQVRELAAHFGTENVMVENDTYHAEARASLSVMRPAAEPGLLSALLRETGCGLLLDIDHARVSAHYMGMPLQAYIAQLPTDRLRELHMTGTRPHPQEGWLQSHHPMQEEDWRIFDWALKRIRSGAWARPEIYAFEYGGVGDEKFYRPSEKAVIAEQVPVLRGKIAALDKEPARAKQIAW